MREVRIASGERPHALDEEHRPDPDPEARSTPGQFFKQVGILIGDCLGLALLARILVMMVGVH